jgi:hypothetical protein
MKSRQSAINLKSTEIKARSHRNQKHQKTQIQDPRRMLKMKHSSALGELKGKKNYVKIEVKIEN